MSDTGNNLGHAPIVCTDCGRLLTEGREDCLHCGQDKASENPNDAIPVEEPSEENPFLEHESEEVELKKEPPSIEPIESVLQLKPEDIVTPLRELPPGEKWPDPKTLKAGHKEPDPFPFADFDAELVPAPEIKPPSKMRPAVYSIVAVVMVIFVAIVLVRGLERPMSGRTTDPGDLIAYDSKDDIGEADEVEKEILASLGEDESDSFDDILEEGKELALKGDWIGAISSYEKALALRNDDKVAIGNLVRAYIETDDIETAFYHIDRWIDLKTGNPEPYALRGAVFFGDGEYEKARIEFDTAMKHSGYYGNARDDYAEKIIEIDEIIAENKRLTEQSQKYDTVDEWEKVETPVPPKPKVESKPKPKPMPVEDDRSVDESPISQIVEKYDPDEEPEADENGGVVLIGGEDKTSEGSGEEVEGTELLVVDDETDEGTIEVEISDEEGQPEHVKVTGVDYDSSANEFSLYLDTIGRASPRIYYDKAKLVLWLTVPNAECDFSTVPRERTFTHNFVESIKTWLDGENVRFRINLKRPINPVSPTVFALGFSLHLKAAPDETPEESEDDEE